MKISISLAWFDLWVGFYYDRTKKILYFCPLPTMLFTFKLGEKN